eukprot:763176-Hanusia_phi.AAC.2
MYPWCTREVKDLSPCSSRSYWARAEYSVLSNNLGQRVRGEERDLTCWFCPLGTLFCTRRASGKSKYVAVYSTRSTTRSGELKQIHLRIELGEGRGSKRSYTEPRLLPEQTSREHMAVRQRRGARRVLHGRRGGVPYGL